MDENDLINQEEFGNNIENNVENNNENNNNNNIENDDNFSLGSIEDQFSVWPKELKKIIVTFFPSLIFVK